MTVGARGGVWSSEGTRSDLHVKTLSLAAVLRIHHGVARVEARDQLGGFCSLGGGGMGEAGRRGGRGWGKGWGLEPGLQQ